jgi:hypothetical protein
MRLVAYEPKQANGWEGRADVPDCVSALRSKLAAAIFCHPLDTVLQVQCKEA